MLFKAGSNSPFRMAEWALLTIGVLLLALYWRQESPSSLVAVTLYKLHLMALAGWAGYWLDRALFPYDRPHTYLELADDHSTADDDMQAQIVAVNAFAWSMLRRSLIVSACLLCVGLGA